MKYVKDNMLQRAEIRKDKPQVVLLITDGIAQDRTLLNSVSSEIRQMGVEVLNFCHDFLTSHFLLRRFFYQVHI